MNTSEVNDLINSIDPTKVQCYECDRWINIEDSEYLYWTVGYPNDPDYKEVRDTRCRNQDDCVAHIKVVKEHRFGPIPYVIKSL